jgi:hypothetical protein
MAKRLKPPKDEKPEWMSNEDWQEQPEELAAWTKHGSRQLGGPEPLLH